MRKIFYIIKNIVSFDYENSKKSLQDENQYIKSISEVNTFQTFSLFKEIFRCFPYIYTLIILVVLYSFLTFLTPFLFKGFLENIQHGSKLAFSPLIQLILSILLSYFIINFIFFHAFKMGLGVRKKISKILLSLLSNETKIETDFLVSLYGQEILKIQSAAQSLPIILLNALISIVSCSFLFYLNGIYALFPIIILLISIYITKKISIFNSKISNHLNQKTQDRVECVSSIFSNIRSIILSGLAGNARKIISDKREEEEFYIHNRINSITFLNLFIQLIPVFLSLSVIFPGLIINGQIKLDIVLPSLLLIGTIRSAFSGLPDLLSEFIFGYSASKRLNLSKFDNDVNNIKSQNTQELFSKIKKNVSLFQFKNPHESKNLVKSISHHSPVIYLSENPWIFKGSLLENICLTQEFIEHEKLNRAILLSCLEKDISIMPDGLYTSIEQDGANLSGGQRQRICIARSIYDSSQIIIAENAFSGLDENTKSQVIDSCINSGWAGRTIIIIDNNNMINKYANLSFSLNDDVYEFNEIQGKFKNKIIPNEMTFDKYPHSIFQLSSILPKFTSIKIEYLSIFKQLSKYASILPILIIAFLLSAFKDSLIFISEILLSNITQDTHYSYLNIKIIAPIFLLILGSLFSYLSIRIILNSCFKSVNILFKNLINLSLYQKISKTNSLENSLSAIIYDQRVLDQSLGQKIIGFISSISIVLTIMIYTSIVAPLFLPALIFIIIFMNMLCLNYRRIVCSLSLVVSQSSGLAMAQISEYQSGSFYLKSRRIQRLWLQKRLIPCFVHLEGSSELLQKAERLYSFRIEFLGTISFVIFALIISHTSSQYSQVTLGLILTYAAAAITLCGRAARMLADLDHDMISLNKTLNLLHEKPVLNNDKLQIQEDFSIHIKDMSFSYEKNNQAAIAIKDFKIPKYGKLAILGRTGVGKSTLVKLISGSLEPTTGFVKVGEVETYNMLQSQYNYYFKFLPQERFLLPGKLKYSFFSEEIPDEELKSIFKTLQLEDTLLEKLELNSNLLESNATNHKFVLASIIASKAKIIILDEPTSSLTHLESIEFIEAIMKYASEKTIIMITHHQELSKQFLHILNLPDRM